MSYRRKRHGILYYLFIWPFAWIGSMMINIAKITAICMGYIIKFLILLSVYIVIFAFYIIWYMIIGIFRLIFHRKSFNIAGCTTGEEYEIACCQALKQHGFTHIETTARTGDHGVDILAHRSGSKYAIQCKYYSSPVGNHAIQEAYSGCKYYDYGIPVVMTNNTFTSNAVDEAQKLGVHLWANNKIPFHSTSLFKTFFHGKGLIKSIKDSSFLIDWKYNKTLKKYGNVYLDMLSSKLGTTVKLIEPQKTEYGYYLTYHSSEPITGKLYALQEDFNRNLEGRYEFKSITDNDFAINIYREK